MSVSAIIFYSMVGLLVIAGMIHQSVNFVKFKRMMRKLHIDEYNLRIKEIADAEVTFTYTFWLFIMFFIMFWYSISLMLPHVEKAWPISGV